MLVRHLYRATALLSLGAILSACGGTHYAPAAQSDAGSALERVDALRMHHTPARPPANPRPLTAADFAAAAASGWHPVAAAAPFGANGAGTPLLLTDGRVLIGDNTSNWYTLTPNASGSYVDGTWAKVASLPSGYGPLYFASAVLPDGKVIVNGGEYNFFHETETNLGAIYDPVANTWTPVAPPTGWSRIGDAQSVVLPNGTYMIGNCCTSAQAQYNESAGTWTTVGSGKDDPNSEEGWTLLPGGDVLDANVIAAPKAQVYSPYKNAWISIASLPKNLTQATEIGPQALRPDGTVLVVGANLYSAIYHTSTKTWTSGPNLPVVNGSQLDATDAPASVLPDGQVMVALSPGVYQPPSSTFLWNGTAFTQVGAFPNAVNDASYNVRFLVLPNGQLLETDGSNDVEIYNAHGTPDAAIAPKVTTVASTLARGSTYKVTGVRFNGFTQANAYGDDAQMATNYPLVEIVNAATKHVFFARTHGHSSMAVASQSTVSTNFDVPANTETGASSLFVVTNGIKSAATPVTIQ